VAVLAAGALLAGCGGAGSASGGVDNGRPGSRCVPRSSSLTRSAESGTRAGRFRGLYYELGDPVPARGGVRTGGEGGAPLMLLIHGGGWSDDGPGQVQSLRRQADPWRAAGWRTLNLDYHACGRSVGDVLSFYDHFQALAGAHAVCAEGLSAGGQLALMLASARPRVRCVIALAAATDLPALARQRTSPSASKLDGEAPDFGPRYAYNLAAAAFGRRSLAALSPALHAHAIRARVLLAVGVNDIFIPWAQQQEFAARHPGYTRILRLPVGPIAWLHGTTTAAGEAEVAAAERRLVAGWR
jgi:dipeptidyl aminopeptidase/acylaminoacyl peptidase